MFILLKIFIGRKGGSSSLFSKLIKKNYLLEEPDNH